MESTKQHALKLIQNLPDDATYEDIMERLSFLQKVEAGFNDIREGKVVEHDDVRARVAEWLR